MSFPNANELIGKRLLATTSEQDIFYQGIQRVWPQKTLQKRTYKWYYITWMASFNMFQLWMQMFLMFPFKYQNEPSLCCRSKGRKSPAPHCESRHVQPATPMRRPPPPRRVGGRRPMIHHITCCSLSPAHYHYHHHHHHHHHHHAFVVQVVVL